MNHNVKIEIMSLKLIFMGGIRIVDSEQEYENEYTARFANDSVEELVDAFNSDQPSQGWEIGRAHV